MPIYEYQCQDCQAEFELIRSFKDADSKTHCADCQGTYVKRKLSLFNASSSGKSLSSSSCSTCTSSNCSTCGGH